MRVSLTGTEFSEKYRKEIIKHILQVLIDSMVTFNIIKIHGLEIVID